MPRLRLHLAGILLTLLLSGCAGSEAAAPQVQPSPAGVSPPAAEPSPQLAGPPAAAQELSFSGDLSGTMSRLTAAGQGAASECTQRPRTTGAWASTLYGYLGDRVYGIVVLVKPYNGPATYDGSEAQVQILSQDQQRVWQSIAGDHVSFTVDNGEQTGSVEANLHNLRSNQRSLKVQGRWSCRP
ncbi:MAG: hypothetical protein J2P39_14370 [Candidatus Dormibacteraeota bacterium]|nr:hypothetical protein [Candidatus Dormibacteraeota bacterium]